MSNPLTCTHHWITLQDDHVIYCCWCGATRIVEIANVIDEEDDIDPNYEYEEAL